MENRIKFIDMRHKLFSWTSLAVIILLLGVIIIMFDFLKYEKINYGILIIAIGNLLTFGLLNRTNFYKNGFSYFKKYCHIKINRRWLKQFIYEDFKEIIFTDNELTITDNKATTVFSLENINKEDVAFLKEKLMLLTGDKTN